MKTNMARQPGDLKTHEGAQAKRITPEQQLMRSINSCLLWENEFYEDGVSIAQRIHDAAAMCSPEFVSQVAIEARTKHGLRHAPLWLTLDLIKRGGKIAGDTVAKVITRADELTELLAMYWADTGPGSAGPMPTAGAMKQHMARATTIAKNNKPLSAQLKRGLAEAFVKFNEYALAKYDRANAVRLRDVLFLTHPKPRDDEQAAVWKRLVDNKLAAPDTWEVALSGGADKKEAFTRLLIEQKLGGLAFLRNLRNMVQAGVDETLIKNAFVRKWGNIFPHQFIAAAKHAPSLEREIDAAMQACLREMPRLTCKTRLLVDVSGSMDKALSGHSEMRRLEAACGLAVLLAGVCDDLEVYTFSNTLVRIPPRYGMALADAIVRSQFHGGTLLGAAVEAVHDTERLIVVTDEQSNDQVPGPSGRGYMINTASNANGVGYGKWVHIDGFSHQCVRFIMQIEASNNQ